MKKNKLFVLMLSVILLFSFACTNEQTKKSETKNPTGDVDVPFSIEGIKENLIIGDTCKITLTGIEEEDLDYSIKGKAISFENMEIKAISAGSVIITFTSFKSSTKLEYNITVSEEPNIEITGGNVVSVGKTLSLEANVSNNELTWKSSDNSIATVKDGVVTGVKLGTCTITATYLGKYEGSIDITVTELVKSISFNVDFVELEIGDVFQLNYLVNPSNLKPEVEVTSTDDTIISIDSDLVVTAINAGDVIVTIRALDGSNAMAQMSIIIEDTIAPVVTYNTTQNIKVAIGTTNWNPLADIKVTDNCDGDITSNVIIISNNVNTNVYGNYVVRYKATDTNGNVLQFIRNVEVYWPYAVTFIGHGGGYFGIMNTMQAIKHSVEVLHYPMIEVDLQQTSDGVFVLCHDEKFGDYKVSSTPWSTFENYYITKNRNTGLPATLGLITESPYTSRICLLTEALDYCKEHGVMLKIELKASKGISGESTSGMQRLMAVIEEHNCIDNVSFTCFPYMKQNLIWLRENGFTGPIQYLCGTCENQDTFDLCKKYNFMCSINPIYGDYKNSDEWIKKYKDAGIKLSAYTFDQNTSYDTVQIWINKGMDYITTDWHDPSKLNIPLI